MPRMGSGAAWGSSPAYAVSLSTGAISETRDKCLPVNKTPLFVGRHQAGTLLELSSHCGRIGQRDRTPPHKPQAPPCSTAMLQGRRCPEPRAATTLHHLCSNHPLVSAVAAALLCHSTQRHPRSSAGRAAPRPAVPRRRRSSQRAA